MSVLLSTLTFMAWVLGPIGSAIIIAAMVSCRLDSGRVVFAEARKALRQCASNWSISGDLDWGPVYCDGLGFRIVFKGPLSVKVRYGSDDIRAGFGWCLRLHWAGYRMEREKERAERLNAVCDALERMDGGRP